MIKIKISDKKIEIRGHANFADYGKDIVCAAVSSIVTTSVNDMLTINKDGIQYVDDAKCVSIMVIQDDDLINKLFNNLKELLKELSNDYPKNVKVESEE